MMHRYLYALPIKNYLCSEEPALVFRTGSIVISHRLCNNAPKLKTKKPAWLQTMQGKGIKMMKSSINSVGIY